MLKFTIQEDQFKLINFYPLILILLLIKSNKEKIVNLYILSSISKEKKYLIFLNVMKKRTFRVLSMSIKKFKINIIFIILGNYSSNI